MLKLILNKRGAILAMTASFVFIFTILGLGAVYFAGTENELTLHKITSSQAFWVAEAGIQRAISRLPADPNPFNGSLNSGTYDVKITPLSSVRWDLESLGNLQSTTRKIEAKYGPPITDAFTTKGDIEIKGKSVEIDGGVVKNANFTFEEIFGMTEAQMQARATQTFEDDPKKDIILEGITWINLVKDSSIKLTSENGSGILVVSGGDLEIAGNLAFDGIIWVSEGVFTSDTGTPNINGAVFVDCQKTDITKIGGNASISYNEEAIDAAYSESNLPPLLKIISWREV